MPRGCAPRSAGEAPGLGSALHEGDPLAADPARQRRDECRLDRNGNARKNRIKPCPYRKRGGKSGSTLSGTGVDRSRAQSNEVGRVKRAYRRSFARERLEIETRPHGTGPLIAHPRTCIAQGRPRHGDLRLEHVYIDELGERKPNPRPESESVPRSNSSVRLPLRTSPPSKLPCARVAAPLKLHPSFRSRPEPESCVGGPCSQVKAIREPSSHSPADFHQFLANLRTSRLERKGLQIFRANRAARRKYYSNSL